jgi:hypothetical protein
MNHEKQKIEKRIRKLRLRSELCSIEAEEMQELDRDYAAQFAEDFELEILFLEHKKSEQLAAAAAAAAAAKKTRTRTKPRVDDRERVEHQHEKVKPLISNDGLKKLHKQLAFELHPDRSKKDDHQEFLEIQSAWDNKEYGKIIDVSLRLEIDLSEILDHDSINEMEKRLKERESSAQSIKRSIRWVWCQSNKSSKLRSFIRRSMGVKEEEFESWLLSKPETTTRKKEMAIEATTNDGIGPAGSSRKALS